MNTKSIFLGASIVICSSVSAFAGGKISGKVLDAKTNEPLIGVTVMVENTTKGGKTDLDGKFILPDLADGQYTLVFKYVAYSTKRVTDIKVKDGAVEFVNISMDQGTRNIKEVVITSTLKKETINSLLTLQKNAASISDGISAEAIRKSPDRNTGEVLKRVSGTTIQDNKFVIVRGLNDRYNTALLDGAVLPSTEPNRKAFSFDIIPAGMIDNVIINKAATPDMPGDFAGGLIKIQTKSIPEENFANISIGTSYNTVSTFKPFYSGPRSSTDILGFDNGMRQLPEGSGFPENTAQTNNLTPSQNINAIDQLNGKWGYNKSNALPGLNLSASAGGVKHLKSGANLGMVGAINYSHTENSNPSLYRSYNDYTQVNDALSTYNTTVGALLNFGYSSGKNKIVFKNIYNRIFDDVTLYRNGDNISNSSVFQYYAFDLQEKSLAKTSVEGEHVLGARNNKIDWNLSLAHIGTDQPDQRKVVYSKPADYANDPSRPYQAEVTTNGKSNNRLFSKLSENIYTVGANYLHPFEMFGEKQSLKVGGSFQYRQRNFDARFLGLVLDANTIDPDVSNAIKARPLETLFGQDLVDQGYYRLSEITNNSDSYKASSKTSAAYAMLDNKLTDKLRLVWGLRTEMFNIQLSSADNNNKPVEIDTTYLDLLPSANLTYSLTPKINVRGSYFRSVARPEFRELAPFSYYDYQLSAIAYGSPLLVRTKIDNVDLRFEYYPKGGEIFSASVFYKHFNNPIEPSIYDANSALELSYRNAPSAQNYGVEFEVRKSLDFIADKPVFRNLSVYANVALIKSSVKLDPAVPVFKGGTERALAGQSPYVINSSLTYTTNDSKMNFTVLYNRVGQRIFQVAGSQRFGNIYEAPRNLLDFQAGYAVTKKLELRLNIKDILNNNYFFYFDQDQNKKFNDPAKVTDGNFNFSNNDMTLAKYKLGTTFSVSVNYKF